MGDKIVAGNWKMNTTESKAISLIYEIIRKISHSSTITDQTNLKIILAPPYLYLKQCSLMTDNLWNIYVAAQNCHTHEKGAFTGEISAPMLSSIGVEYVIIGHSERRRYFHEDNLLLAEKIKVAMMNGLKPIFCIGEVLEERKAGMHFEVVKKQLEESLFGISASALGNKVVLAYEPVWAIGTGLTATPDQAQEMHSFIRKTFAEKYGKRLSKCISIIYGGSCNAGNAKELFSMADVDGGLIGGASLNAEEFVAIVEAII
jgi:triosephosphate isomerase (TIM)